MKHLKKKKDIVIPDPPSQESLEKKAKNKRERLASRAHAIHSKEIKRKGKMQERSWKKKVGRLPALDHPVFRKIQRLLKNVKGKTKRKSIRKDFFSPVKIVKEKAKVVFETIKLPEYIRKTKEDIKAYKEKFKGRVLDGFTGTYYSGRKRLTKLQLKHTKKIRFRTMAYAAIYV